VKDADSIRAELERKKRELEELELKLATSEVPEGETEIEALPSTIPPPADEPPVPETAEGAEGAGASGMPGMTSDKTQAGNRTGPGFPGGPGGEQSGDDLERLRIIREEAELKIKELEEKKRMENRKKEENLRESYRREVAEFATLGYNTRRLEPYFLGDIGSLRSEVMKFMADIRALKELEVRLDRFDMHGLEDHVKPLMEMLHDPDRVNECRSLVDDLESEIEKRTMKAMERKKARIAEIRDTLDNLEKNASSPRHLKKIDRIKQLIYKPEADLDDLEYLSGETLRLKKAMEEGTEEEDEKHRESLKREIGHYKKKGYRTAAIENIVRRAPVEKAREEYMKFLAAVGVLRDGHKWFRRYFEQSFFYVG